MDHFSEMSIFVAVAEENGLAAAARRTQQSAPTVTRAIAGLEARLGVKLLERNTRGVSLTSAGERYFADSRRILNELEKAESSAAGMHSKPAGTLHISTPLLFGQNLLMPILLDYLDEFPEVSAKTQFIDRFPNLHEEGVDVAILMGHLPDSSLIALKVGEICRVIVGSPRYFERHDMPKHPSELQRHVLLASLADTRSHCWHFREQDEELAISIMPRWLTSTNTSAISGAIAGDGLTRAMSYQVFDALEQQQLQRILRDYEPDPMPVYVVYREGRRAAARVRSFVDFATKRLRAIKWL